MFMIIGFLCAFLVISVDQLSKFLVYGTAARSIIGQFLWFESTLNTGVAFSMFSGNSIVFFIIACLASAGFSYFIISKKWLESRWEKASIGLILGGTISNAIDRLVFSGVRDFIYLKFMNFAIFNVADICVTIGGCLFAIGLVVNLVKSNNSRKAK